LNRILAYLFLLLPSFFNFALNQQIPLALKSKNLTIPLTYAPEFKDVNQSMVNYSKAQGLSQVTVVAIEQDQLGFVWFGTQGGLNRFDGYEFKHFNAEPLKQDKLAGNFITALCDDGSHKLWIGSSAGLSVYDYQQGTFKTFLSNFHPEILNDNVTSLKCDKNKVWVGTNGTGFYHIDYKTNNLTSYKKSKGLRVLGIEVANNSVYLATDKGLYQHNLDNGDFLKRTNHSSKSISILNRLLYVGRHDGWVDSYSFLQKPFTRHLHIKVSPIMNNTINSIVNFNDQLWLSTNNGIYLINSKGKIVEKHIHHPLIPKSLADDIVLSILIDKKKNLWIGSDSGGINYLSRSVKHLGHINKYSYPDAPLVEDDIRGFTLDRQNRLWFATTRGAYIFENERFYNVETLYSKLSVLGNAFITKILFHKNAAWLTTLGHGIFKLDFDSEQVTIYSPEQKNSPSLRFNAMVVYQGELLFTARDNGILKLNVATNTLQPYLSQFANAPKNSTGILVNENDLWFGTNGEGVFRLHANQLEQLTVQDGLLSNLSFSLEKDNKGNVWVASDAGINIINSQFEVEKTLDQTSGLIGNSVWAMVFDGNDSIWIGSSDGLTQISTDNFLVRNFNESDGIQGFEYNFGAAWLSPSGRVFIGGTNGFNQFLPKTLHAKPNMPALFLTQVTILGEEINSNSQQGLLQTQPEYLKRLNLMYDHDIMSFKYSSLAYSHQHLDYYYRVVGFSEQWLLMDKESRKVNLIKLPPGEYQLEVYLQNRQGEKSELHQLKITLNSPWWWSSVSQVIYALVILTIIVFIIYLKHLNFRKVVKANVKMSNLQQRLQHS